MFIQIKQKSKFVSVQIDKEDFEKVASRSWFVTDRGYVRSSAGSPRVLLHRFLMIAPAGSVVDHRNGDKLDNRKSNLRIASHSENMRNRKLSKAGTKGVTWRPAVGKWEASIKFDKRSIFLGRYIDKLQAIAAYDAASVHYHGDYAKPNFDAGQSLKDAQCKRATRNPSGTGFIGVTKDARANSFRAEVKFSGAIWRASFSDVTEAAKARDAMAIEMQGSFAKLNFPVFKGAS